MLSFKRFKLQFSLLALCCVTMQTLPADYFDTLKIETTSQATGASLAFVATSACALYCGKLAYDIIDGQNKKAASENEYNKTYSLGNVLARASRFLFGTHRQDPGNVGNPPHSFNYVPYIWSTISGFALLRSAVIARSLYDYYIKA